ncbi:hypothetical protein GJ633_06525 [Halorubrum sp. CBA1125]|uniref:hypothetical protein n=1 Tax=Halorubrum sp. CBA1125 TaxID=2668072 RepID=UPI0012E76B0D|nr:hypothetical protein [Halorubrum sp. CBA1125]MUW14354.1 hypothetical protein [Halorubrum sp. CBA1125]
MRRVVLLLLVGAVVVFGLFPGPFATMGSEIAVDATAGDEGAFTLAVEDVRPCGQRCGAATLTITNTRGSLATNVSVEAVVYAGRSTDGTRIWTTTERAGDIRSGETTRLTQRATWNDETVDHVRAANGWVTFEITVRSDEAAVVFTGSEQLG